MSRRRVLKWFRRCAWGTAGTVAGYTMCVNLVGTEYWLPVAYPFEPQLMDEGLFTWTDDRWWLAGTGDSAKEVFQNYNKAKSLRYATPHTHTHTRARAPHLKSIQNPTGRPTNR